MGYDFDVAGAASGGLSTGLGTIGTLGLSGIWNPVGWGAAALGALGGGLRKKQKSQIPWGQVVRHPEYEHTAGRMRKTSDFLTDNIDSLSQGEEMPWISRYFDGEPGSGMGISAQMQEQLKQRYQGSGTQQGAYDIAAQAGSVSGVGPKATQANVNKQVQDYQNKSAAIDTEIAKIRSGMQQQAASSFPNLAMSMPRGPEVSIIGGGGGGGGSGGYGGGGYGGSSVGPDGAMGGVNTLMELAKSGILSNIFKDQDISVLPDKVWGGGGTLPGNAISSSVLMDQWEPSLGVPNKGYWGNGAEYGPAPRPKSNGFQQNLHNIMDLAGFAGDALVNQTTDAIDAAKSYAALKKSDWTGRLTKWDPVGHAIDYWGDKWITQDPVGYAADYWGDAADYWGDKWGKNHWGPTNYADYWRDMQKVIRGNWENVWENNNY